MKKYTNDIYVTLKWFPVGSNMKYILFYTVKSGFGNLLFCWPSAAEQTVNVSGSSAGLRKRDESTHCVRDQVPLEFWHCSQISHISLLAVNHQEPQAVRLSLVQLTACDYVYNSHWNPGGERDNLKIKWNRETIVFFFTQSRQRCRRACVCVLDYTCGRRPYVFE